jgi:ankyrin repeat protein
MKDSQLSTALAAGNLDAVRALVEAGADLCYTDENGYDALLDAVHGRDILRDAGLLELLGYLVDRGVNLSGVSKHGESAVRVLSRIGRFDALRLLLRAGADRGHLKWTRLHEAVALGSLTDVETALEGTRDLEARDWWSRTPWLLAVATGDVAKAKVLKERGADTGALGRCGSPALFHAIRGGHTAMLRWLLEEGADIHQRDEFGGSALIEAVEHDDLPCVQIVLEAGADVAVNHNGTALSAAMSRDVILRLLEAGADPGDLGHEGKRVLLKLRAVDESLLDSVSPAEFARNGNRRFGTGNPEVIKAPFWEAMIRSGVNAYVAAERFPGVDAEGAGPTWCADRFGQSFTKLPDGRVVLIGGEHEDSYDPDFCIYNDVFVFEPNGAITIFGYPETVFPPTDFHSATLVGKFIYVIGCLGYAAARGGEQTPVHRLDLETMRFDAVETTGESPGHIYKHRAEAINSTEIRVWGGKRESVAQPKNVHEDNQQSYVLDLERRNWRRVGNV